jgi:hypothetical protein
MISEAVVWIFSGSFGECFLFDEDWLRYCWIFNNSVLGYGAVFLTSLRLEDESLFCLVMVQLLKLVAVVI